MANNTFQTAPVTHLVRWARARRAAAALRGLLHEPDWLIDVQVRLLASGDPEVVVAVTSMATHIVRCLPSSVDNVLVRILPANCERKQEGPGR